MPSGRPKKYHTEEERKEAMRSCYARYRENHRESIRERNKVWEETNKEERNARRRQRYRDLHPLPEDTQTSPDPETTETV